MHVVVHRPHKALLAWTHNCIVRNNGDDRILIPTYDLATKISISFLSVHYTKGLIPKFPPSLSYTQTHKVGATSSQIRNQIFGDIDMLIQMWLAVAL